MCRFHTEFGASQANRGSREIAVRCSEGACMNAWLENIQETGLRLQHEIL